MKIALKYMKKKLSMPVLMAICILLLTACSKQEMHDFAEAHPLLMVLYGLVFLAIIVGLIRLIVGAFFTIVFYVLTFFLPFNLD